MANERLAMINDGGISADNKGEMNLARAYFYSQYKGSDNLAFEDGCLWAPDIKDLVAAIRAHGYTMVCFANTQSGMFDVLALMQDEGATLGRIHRVDLRKKTRLRILPMLILLLVGEKMLRKHLEYQ